ncbi:fibronectin type III domain-containing protein [Rummeliibacillus pycnus]|uniref:fibronectin type III domain-containing protein n=1 Tax=Rummeliibacillus pycnus TaxID=101070 RepID=UPI000C9AAB3C|nr:fibronectin type III domain-containing protein [Rummeliibacillus pycnus]
MKKFIVAFLTLICSIFFVIGNQFEASAVNAPSKPYISVKATSTTKIKISYKKVKGATTYQIYRANSKVGKYKHIVTTKNTSYTDRKLKSSTTYYYKVRAIKKVGKKTYYSKYSIVKSIKTLIPYAKYAGTYKVGNDIAAGEYMIFGKDVYYEIAKEPSNFEAILSNDIVYNQAYVRLSKGQYFKLDDYGTGAYFIPSSKVKHILSTSVKKPGMYKIGTDLKAGTYKISFGSYYEVMNDSAILDFEAIVYNGEINGTEYVKVKNDQFLKISPTYY